MIASIDYEFNQISCTHFVSPSLCLPSPSPRLSLCPSLPYLPFPPPLPPLLLISQHSTEDEPVEHGVAIIADTDTWTCRLVVATRDSQTK